MGLGFTFTLDAEDLVVAEPFGAVVVMDTEVAGAVMVSDQLTVTTPVVVEDNVGSVVVEYE